MGPTAPEPVTPVPATPHPAPERPKDRRVGSSPQYFAPSDPLFLLIKERCERGSFSPESWTVHRRREQSAIWVEFAPKGIRLPSQGFKLHISATLTTAVQMCDRVMSVLERRPASFKVIGTLDAVAAGLNGKFGLTQVGKFITVYPRPEDLPELALDLHDATIDVPGPRIQGERTVARDSHVHYRFGAFQQIWMQQPTGRFVPAIDDPTVGMRPDARGSEELRPDDPFADSTNPDGDARDEAPLRSRYLVLQTLHSGPKGSSWLALDLSAADPTPVVVKEARAWTMPDRHGVDARARLADEARVLDYLAGSGLAPEFVDYWDEGWRSCLVYRFIPGIPLKEIVSELAGNGMTIGDEFLWSLASDAAEIMDSLHDRGVVFGDFKPENVVRGVDGSLHLIDFELAVGPGTSGGRGFGTPGYVSPAQSELDHPPDAQDDRFSFGATLLGIATGVDLSTVGGAGLKELLDAHQADLSPQTYALIHDLTTDVGPTYRPRGLKAAIEQGTTAAARRPALADPPFDPMEEAKAIGDSLLASATIDGPSAYWTSDHPVAPGVPSRDLYVGNAGIALTLTNLYDLTGTDHYLDLARATANWLADGGGSAFRATEMPGLYFGEAGVGLLYSELFRRTGEERYLELALDRARLVTAQKAESFDLMTGMAGIGLFLLVLHDVSGDRESRHEAVRIADELLSSGDEGGWFWTVPPGFEGLSGNRYLGMAHGSAGIGWFLARAASVTGSPRHMEAVGAIAQQLAEAAEPSLNGGRGLNWADVVGNHPSSLYWCHGATGIGRFFLAAYGVLGESSYLQTAVRAAKTVVDGGRWIGPTQCHGLAGSIDFLVDLHQATNEAERLSEARALGLLLRRKFRLGTGAETHWQSELPQVVTPDYMVGEAGVAMAFIRLANPALRHALAL